MSTDDVEVKQDLNEYSYLETGGFTSERFKVEVRNLPKFYGISEFRKVLTNKLNVNPVKVKPPFKNGKWLYVTFKNEEERDKAKDIINSYEWKGSKLECRIAEPAPDPLFKKRKNETNADNEVDSKKIDSRSQDDKLKENVIPYWNMPYEEQIQIKEKEMRKILAKLGNELWKYSDYNSKKDIEKKRAQFNGLICEFLPIKFGKKIEGYRNKCEFTIGIDDETKLPTVGFRLATYASGFTGVAPIDGLCHISPEMKKIVVLFQDFVRSSNLKVYSPENHSGNWKQLTIRQSAEYNDLMLIVYINSQNLDNDALEDLKTKLVNFFIKEDTDNNHIKSIYLNFVNKSNSVSASPVSEHIYGETHIHDCIHGLKFRISPQAFFQINTETAGILYQNAIDISEINPNSTLLDICCGTGTIGLCFSKHCDEVLGLELISEAVIDAKANAISNNCKNAEFFTGKAEEILHTVAARSRNENVFAVVDPPRSGLHVQGIIQLRRTKKIQKLIYISCNPNAAMKNFIDLTRPSSKTMRGDPFFPTKAVAVDMFPHTKHTELIILFERITSEDAKKE